MTDAEARAALQRLIDRNKDDYAGLSRLIGRNPAYVQQYLRRGTPRRLAEDDRRKLARYFGVDETELGGADPDPVKGPVSVPRLDLAASAGPGSIGDEQEVEVGIAFDPEWLKRMSGGRIDQLSMLRVEGDSMIPTLSDGDEILVDRSVAAMRSRDGIYVLRMDEALLVKRLSHNPASRRLSIQSDNPAYPSWPECDPASVHIVGRVIWAGRRIG